MRRGHQYRRYSLLQKSDQQIEPTLFGGYHPVSGLLVISVEAASTEDAMERISEVAPLVDIRQVAGLILREMETPSREAPLFMDGYFEAIGFGTQKDDSKLKLKLKPKPTLKMVRDTNSLELMTS